MTGLLLYAIPAGLTLAWEAYRLRRVLTAWVALRAVFVAALWPLAWLARAGDRVLEGMR